MRYQVGNPNHVEGGVVFGRSGIGTQHERIKLARCIGSVVQHQFVNPLVDQPIPPRRNFPISVHERAEQTLDSLLLHLCRACAFGFHNFRHHYDQVKLCISVTLVHAVPMTMGHWVVYSRYSDFARVLEGIAAPTQRANAGSSSHASLRSALNPLSHFQAACLS